MPTPEQVTAGQAVYTPRTLRNYDWFVLGFSDRFLWRCPTTELLKLYQRNVAARHLDVGVGTGYFLDRVAWPVAEPSITLLDLNPHCLIFAAGRLARYRPAMVRADVFRPLPDLGPFDSVGLCYLLHCLPGTMAEKAEVFDRLKPVLAPAARIFGATIVQGDAPRSAAARALMAAYNRNGVFSNRADAAENLTEALTERFADVAVTRRGAVALFEARAV